MEELQDIFDTWEEERPDSDDEEEDDDDDDDNGKENHGGADAQKGDDNKEGDYITTSHLRHFVAQPYIHPPLLLPGDGRKFHLRTYVLAVGCLDVYVYSDMLALFAGKPYTPPWESSNDLDAHLTNTCLQQPTGGDTDNSSKPPPVRRFDDLVSSGDLSTDMARDILSQIHGLTGDLFEAAARAMMIHFQPQPNAFEVYGLDFLVGADGTAWLLEVNAFPDFKQTGDGAEGELKDVVAGFWKETLRIAVGGFFGVEARGGETAGAAGAAKGKMEHVRKVDLGRR